MSRGVQTFDCWCGSVCVLSCTKHELTLGVYSLSLAQEGVAVSAQFRVFVQLDLFLKSETLITSTYTSITLCKMQQRKKKH